MFQYTLALAELNTKLEAELCEARDKLCDANATIESHARLEDDMVLQLHTAKNLSRNQNLSRPSDIQSTKSTDSTKSSDSTLLALQEQINIRRSVIKADEKVLVERDLLRLENENLRNLLAKNINDLYAARLTSKYLDKELAGRIQQIQLIGKGKMTAENFGKLWTQLESEIFLHRQKTLIQACRANSRNENAAGDVLPSISVDEGTGVEVELVDPEKAAEIERKNALEQQAEKQEREAEAQKTEDEGVEEVAKPEDQPATEKPVEATIKAEKSLPSKKIREVHFLKNNDKPLGMSITGGVELGVPIIISDLKPNGLAAETGELVVGDAILCINGMSLKGLNHTEAAAVLSNASGEICLEVQFLMAS